ncbi:MAG: hypothetical protein ACKV2T_08045 [Kofleriaceae bacterium]
MFTIRAAMIAAALFVTHTASADDTRRAHPEVAYKPFIETPEDAARFREVDRRPQLQADLGLSVICLGYEHPMWNPKSVSVFLGAGIFGTYFLPWFDRGDNTVGAVADVRVTWFPRSNDGRGLYVTPYGRVGYAAGDDEETGAHGGGIVVTAGAFVGYAFRLSNRLDLRVGAGGQYIYIDGENGVGASTPFVALDIVLGFRL